MVLGCLGERRFLDGRGCRLLLGLRGFRGVLVVLVVLVGKACMVAEWSARMEQSVACLGCLALLERRACRVGLAFLLVRRVQVVLANSIRRSWGLG